LCLSRSGTKIEGGVRDGDGDWLYPISTTTPSVGGGLGGDSWYHVVLTFDGTGSDTEYAKLYVNGSLEDTESSSNHDLNTQNNYVSVGAKNNDGTISNYFLLQLKRNCFEYSDHGLSWTQYLRGFHLHTVSHILWHFRYHQM
jgi:hypothetical protein